MYRMADGVPGLMDGTSCRDNMKGFFPGVVPLSKYEGKGVA
jgi:hypothetical protein